MFSSYIVTLH